jgi:hypothetical protein
VHEISFGLIVQHTGVGHPGGGHVGKVMQTWPAGHGPAEESLAASGPAPGESLATSGPPSTGTETISVRPPQPSALAVRTSKVERIHGDDVLMPGGFSPFLIPRVHVFHESPSCRLSAPRVRKLSTS